MVGPSWSSAAGRQPPSGADLRGGQGRKPTSYGVVMDLISPEDLVGFPFKVHMADLPEGVAAIVTSGVEPSEMLPGETIEEALTRLNRAVLIRS